MPAGYFFVLRGIGPIPEPEPYDLLEALPMLTVKKQTVSIFVDRSSSQWIVLDPDGAFWIVPASEHGWDRREPFTPTEECELEPVPRHYKYMLGVPF